MSDDETKICESVRFWRLNSISALKMMTWRHESQAQDPEEYAAILANNAELKALRARENAVKTRQQRILNQRKITL